MCRGYSLCFCFQRSFLRNCLCILFILDNLNYRSVCDRHRRRLSCSQRRRQKRRSRKPRICRNRSDR